MSKAPHHPLEINFNYTPEKIMLEAEQLIAESKKRLDQISNADPLNWSSVMEALNDEEECFGKFSLLDFFSHVSDDKALRDASLEASKLLNSYSIERSQHAGVFKAVRAISTNYMSDSTLTDEQKYYTFVTLRDFVRSGLELPEEDLARLREVKKEIGLLCIEFSNNISEDKTSLEFTAEELDGLPSSYFESLSKNEQNGKYIVTLQYPDMFPVLRKCKVSNTRKILNITKLSQCQEKNVPIFEKIIKLRQQEAQILGFKTPAHYELDIRMAKNPETVFEFIQSLTEKLETGLLKEMETLLDLKKEECKALDVSFDGVINSWDRLYYQEQLLINKYYIDDDYVSQYFPLEHVVENTLKIYEILFNVNFKLVDADVSSGVIWHKDVKKYNVFDQSSGEYLGSFFLDLHPRPGKYTHAAEFGLRSRCVYEGKLQYPIACIVANFTKPTSSKPSLLNHSEVVTWGHELGHALHVILSKTTYSSLSGTNVQGDFVEAPSQALENWFYEPEILNMISCHYETKSPLPTDLITKIAKARNANIAIELRRQLFFSKFDMVIHVLSPDVPVDSQSHWNSLCHEITKVELPRETNGVASFGHLVGGYQAGYYSYLWSQVYSAEIFKVFKQGGILNQEIGMSYRSKVLAPGGSKNSIELMVDFLNRKPNDTAFMEQINFN